MEFSDIESLKIFNVHDISAEKDGDPLQFDVLVETDDAHYRFTGHLEGNGHLHYDLPNDFTGDQDFEDDLYDLIGASIHDLDDVEQAKVLLETVEIWDDHQVRDNGRPGIPTTMTLWVSLPNAATTQAALAPGKYYLMDGRGNAIPFNTAEEYVDLIAHAEDDFAALVQAATIRHALGEQSAACPSATRKI